jgi:hypothetical protein
MSNTKVRMTIEYNISDQTMVDMLDAAGYGIGYWARSLEDTHDAAETVIVVERGDIHGPDDQDVEHRTNYATLRDAFRKLAAPDQDYVGSTIHGYFWDAVKERDESTGEIDAGHIDSDAADCLVQVALFNEVRFG